MDAMLTGDCHRHVKTDVGTRLDTENARRVDYDLAVLYGVETKCFNGQLSDSLNASDSN